MPRFCTDDHKPRKEYSHVLVDTEMPRLSFSTEDHMQKKTFSRQQWLKQVKGSKTYISCVRNCEGVHESFFFKHFENFFSRVLV